MFKLKTEVAVPKSSTQGKSGYVSLELTITELYKVIGSLSFFADQMDNANTLAYRHKALEFRQLASQLDKKYAEAVNFHPAEIKTWARVNVEL